VRAWVRVCICVRVCACVFISARNAYVGPTCESVRVCMCMYGLVRVYKGICAHAYLRMCIDNMRHNGVHVINYKAT